MINSGKTVTRAPKIKNTKKTYLKWIEKQIESCTIVCKDRIRRHNHDNVVATLALTLSFMFSPFRAFVVIF